jgi:hypothetical protein
MLLKINSEKKYILCRCHEEYIAHDDEDGACQTCCCGGNYKEPVKKVPSLQNAIIIPAALSLFHSSKAFAASPNQYNEVNWSQLANEATQPIFDLLIAAGIPVAGIAIGVAAYCFMFGKERKGWRIMLGAGLGVIILYLIPLGMYVLSTIGNGLSK